MNFVCFNGRFIPKNELSFYDVERFRVADACFESMLFTEGKIPLIDLHQKRLDTVCKQLSFDFFTIDEGYIHELIAKNGISNNARIRISLIRESGKNYTPNGSKIQSLLECERFSEPFQSIENLGIYTEFTKSSNKLGSFKHSSALLYVLAKQYGIENGYDDVLIKNENQHLIEASSSNLFMIKDGQIYTSKNNSGCVLGVCRKFLLNFLNVNLVEISEEMISLADEVFLSNAVQLVQSVKYYEGKLLDNTMTNNIINQVKAKLTI